VSLQKLSKQLRRELKTNPKKVGMLALLAVVAGWFWAPLIFKSDKHAVASSAPAAAPVVVMNHAAAVNTTPGAAIAEAGQRWQDIARLIDEDAQMRPITVSFSSGEAKTPFEPSRGAPPVVVVTVQPTVTEVEPDVTPDDLGLSVSSILIGRDRRTAMINGKMVVEGREIEVKDGVMFLVSRIETGRVVLDRKGQKYELVIKRTAAKSGRTDIRNSP
jgi:hypothetical protein